MTTLTSAPVSPSTPGATPAGSAASRPGAVLTVILLGYFMAVLDVAIVNVALPTIRSTLHSSGAGLELSVSGYSISYAVFIVTGARLGDLWGHARVLRFGLVLFTLASLACGLAPDTAALVAFRLAQGLGSAAMMPQVLSLIQRTFTGPARLKAMSLYTAVVSGGAVAGQVLGGLIISANLFGSSWRPCFLVNVPVGLGVLIASFRVLPKDAGEPGRGLDPRGLAVLTPSVLAVVVPLVLGHDEHWPLWGWPLLGAGLLGFALFGAVEARVGRRGGSPVIPARVLRHPGFAVGVATLGLSMVLMMGLLFSITLHLQGALRLSPLGSGLAFVPQAVAVFVISMTWRRLPAHRYAAAVVCGFLLLAAVLAGLAAVLRHGGTGGFDRWVLMTLLGVGLGLAFSPLMGLMLSRVPVADAADASGVVATVAQLGQVTGVATLGTLFLNLDAAGTVSCSAHALTVVLLVSAGLAVLGGAAASRIPRPDKA
ncbi:MFS transporter [Actinospica durhamensis]|uniref:MFS transporter n=1 Tax=Actinospica durhamensis TaxID=1508375 RepID=A0A941IN28_9ACTN|nr:MFS transporter [Actinospica durhamensis]MBR7834930.1 MFS transporter [Actinospica durhamensis]